MDSSMMPQSSAIYVPTGLPIEDWLISLRQAFPASHTPMQENERDQKIVVTSGPIPSDALARWDQVTQSWRTFQASFLTDMPTLLQGSFPKSGMTRNGILCPLPMPVRPIPESDGGALPGRWMTLSTMDSLSPKSQKALDHEYTHRPNRSNPGNLRDQIAVAEGKSTWPTPRAREGNAGAPRSKGSKHNAGRGYLDGVVQEKWPTPKSQDSKHGPLTEWEKNTNHPGTKDSLRYKVMMKWPTPTANEDAAGTSDGKMQKMLGNHPDVRSQGVGTLNPNWVSWLMGIPTGWDSLEPLDRKAYDEWFAEMRNGTWWDTERDLPRVATGTVDRVKRLRALGNGIVPASLALFLDQFKARI